MKIIFRTDSSDTIGSGHVMRCLTLADALKLRGAAVTFICREHPGNLIALIETKGYPVARLPETEARYVAKPEDVAHAAWLGVSWQSDVADTVAALGKIQADWLIADHYSIDCRWEAALRLSARKIMVIDDLADRSHDCDLLLDQNLYQAMETRYDALVAGTCQKLLGPKYALLRPEFAEARKNLRRRSGEVKRVLVFFGGVDPNNETEKTLQALAGGADRQFAVDVVLGAGYLDKERIRNFCARHDGFHCHCQVDNMAQLMAAADLAIGAGGATTWERCALGVPSLVIVIAENQLGLALDGAEKGLFFYLGAAATVTSNYIEEIVGIFLRAPATLRCYAMTALKIVDARGTARVAGTLVPPRITMRKALEKDCDSIYEWRNAAETRRFFFDAKGISLESHRVWFGAALEDPCRILLVGEINGFPAGVVRYDIADAQAVISVYLVPGGQGQGTGSELIRCGSKWLKAHHPEVETIRAEVVRENSASCRAFENAGYEEHYVIYLHRLEGLT